MPCWPSSDVSGVSASGAPSRAASSSHRGRVVAGSPAGADADVSRRTARGPRRADGDLHSLRPGLTLHGRQAMGHNKLIYALSDVTVAVAADNGSGGTWSGAA